MASRTPKEFTFHPSVAKFNVSFKDLRSTINTTSTTTIDGLATGAIAFSEHRTPHRPQLLLVQRSATDSMPNRWEIPGGAVNAGETVLAGAARELYEESGLVVKRVAGLLVHDESEGTGEETMGGYLFCTRSGKRILKFTFVVEVEDSSVVWLDPDEHQDYVWATEDECRAKKVVRDGADGRGNVDLEFTTVAQEAAILKAFAQRTAPRSLLPILAPASRPAGATKTVCLLHLTPAAPNLEADDTRTDAMDSPPSSEWDEKFFDSAKPLQGVVVCCTSIPANERTDLGNKVTELGGQHEYDLTPKTTHLIVGEHNTTKYRHVAKSRPDIRPMAMGWVDAIRNLWVQDNHIEFCALEKHWTLKTFETGGAALDKTGQLGPTRKLTCCISGMDKEERDGWIAQIEANGGLYSGNLDKTVTHLIIREPSGKKYLAAKKWQQHIVAPEWLADSLARGMILDEVCYDPHLPREDIGRGAWMKRENRRKPLSKRLREAAEVQSESGRRKLRKTASMKLNSQRENMWGEILAKRPSADQSGASLLAEEPTQPLPSDSILWNRSEQSCAKDSIGGVNVRPDGIFSSCQFHISGFSRQHVEVLVQHITSRGGSMATSLDELNPSEAMGRCFFVVPQASSISSYPPTPNGIEVVTDFFIEKCVYKTVTALPDSKAHVIGRPFPVFPIESFEKLYICTSGFTELDLLHISKVVRQLGARYEECFTAKCSILVCTSLSAVRKQKLDMALAFGTPIVRADWLWECISQGMKLPSQDFVFPELKSRKLKALPNKSLHRSKSTSDMNKKPTLRSLAGRAEAATRTSLRGPDLSAFDGSPLVATDSPASLSRSNIAAKDSIMTPDFTADPPDSLTGGNHVTKDSNITPDFDTGPPASLSRIKIATADSGITPDFGTAPMHQEESNTGSQLPTLRPVSRSGAKALSEWSADDINKFHNDQQPSQPWSKPLTRVRSEVCDSEAGDDDGHVDFAGGDNDDTVVQDTVQVEDPVELEKRRIKQEKVEKAAAERLALSNKLTTLLEGSAGTIGDKSLKASVSGAAADESGRAAPGPPPARRKRNIIGRVVSNASAASSVSQESVAGRSGGLGRTHSAVVHDDDAPDDEETAATGPMATQIEYADPEASKSKDRLRKKMLGQSDLGGSAPSSADGKLTLGDIQNGASLGGSRAMRRR